MEPRNTPNTRKTPVGAESDGRQIQSANRFVLLLSLFSCDFYDKIFFSVPRTFYVLSCFNVSLSCGSCVSWFSPYSLVAAFGRAGKSAVLLSIRHLKNL